MLAAQGVSTHAGTALADLCAAYYAPVHSYIARTAHDLGDPRDLTQEFFARLLAGSVLAGAERQKGRFRGYLLGAVKHYLADTRDRLRAAKRGAQHEQVPLVPGTDTSPGLELCAPEAQPPDAWFDRQWGLAVLDLALASLAAEHEHQGKAEQFQVLKPWLTGDAGGMSQAEAAARLGLSEGAVKGRDSSPAKTLPGFGKGGDLPHSLHRAGGSRGIALPHRSGELSDPLKCAISNQLA